MFEENRGEVPTFQQFMEKKEGQLDQISKVKSQERQDRFMKKKKKTEMVKVLYCIVLYSIEWWIIVVSK